MIRSSKTGNVMNKLIPTFRSTIRLLMLMMILMSLSGCGTVKVISADQTEVFISQGAPAPADGVWMSEARYQRYRRAVADAILKEQTK